MVVLKIHKEDKKQKVQLTVNEVNALMKMNLFKIFLQKGEKSINQEKFLVYLLFNNFF